MDTDQLLNQTIEPTKMCRKHNIDHSQTKKNNLKKIRF